MRTNIEENHGVRVVIDEHFIQVGIGVEEMKSFKRNVNNL